MKIKGNCNICFRSRCCAFGFMAMVHSGVIATMSHARPLRWRDRLRLLFQSSLSWETFLGQFYLQGLSLFYFFYCIYLVVTKRSLGKEIDVGGCGVHCLFYVSN